MQVTIRKSVSKGLLPEIEQAIADAREFMLNKYPDVNFDIELIFSSGMRRSRYFRNASQAKDGSFLNCKYATPVAQIDTRSLLILYDMKSLNIVRRQLEVGSYVQMTCAIVHELTHHVQYEKGLLVGELLTTSNELELLKTKHPEYWDYMMVE